MAKPHQRIAALVIALLFLATSVATGAAVIWEMTRDKDDVATTQSTAESELESLQQTSGCTMDQPPAAKEAVPEAYKTDTDIRELQKTDLVQGNGETVKSGDCLIVKYHGTLLKSGEKFDGNFDQETALQFKVGIGQVIPGWDQGLEGMKVGGTRRLVIPSDLAYGETGSGSIPANADLVFVVKLIEIKETNDATGN